MKHSTLTMFRRVMALSLALLLVVGLTGCFGKGDEKPTDPPAVVDPTDAPTEKPTEKPTEAPTEKPTEPPVKGVMGTVSANNLNVRSNHASDSAVLSQLPVNLRIEILEQKTVGGTNWGRIGETTLPNGKKIDGGWLNLHYVKLDNADDQTGTGTGTGSDNATTVDPDEEKLGTITAQQLQIRKGAGTTYDTAGSYKKGDRVKILETKTVSGTTWGKTDKGWVSMTYVKLDGSAGSAVDTGTNVAQPGATKPTTGSSTGTGTGTGTATSTVEVSNGKTTILGYVVVDTKGLTLRAGPGTSYKSLGTAVEGDRYPYYQTSNNWYRTSAGWLSNADDAYLYIEGTTADDAAMATILAEEMHVRQGPGTNFKSVTTLKQGEMLVVLGQSDGWGYTRLGWINVDDEYVDLDEELTYVTGDAEVLVDGLNVREDADAESKKLSSLDKGDDVEILQLGGKKDNWGKIEYASGKEGWINMSYVKMTSASSGGSSSTAKYDVTIGELTNGDGCEITPSTKYCAKGTKVTLYIKTADGLKLKSLIVTDANGNSDNITTSKKFTMPASNVTVTAEFINESDIEYKVTIGKITGNGKVALKDDTDTFTAGTTVELEVEPDTGYELDKVYYNGTEVTGDSFEMPVGDVTVTATFTAIKYDVNLIDDGNGTVEANKVEAAFGETIKLTIKPAEGYVLDTIELDAEYDVTVSNKTFEMPPCSVDVYVTFKEKEAS